MREDNELELYVVNDGFLYRTIRAPIEKTLAQLKLAGSYSRADALRRYERLADEGAKRYLREFPGSPRFTLGERRAAAGGMLEAFETEHGLGNMRHHAADHAKTPAQLQREIDAALGSRTRILRR